MSKPTVPLSFKWFELFAYWGHSKFATWTQEHNKPGFEGMSAAQRHEFLLDLITYTDECAEAHMKSSWLSAFETQFYNRCAAAGIAAHKWKEGMWCNAHMYHGMGMSVEEGVAKWFDHVKKHADKLASLPPENTGE